MPRHAWVQEFPAPVTVCDRDGKIIEMNEASRALFAKDGGADLIGSNLLDCHPEPSKSELADMLAQGRGKTYTIGKQGKRKLIHQSPWYENGAFMGLVEISVDLPPDMPDFDRG